MPTCHACHTEFDVSSLAAGRCGKCGAALQTVPQRNLQEVRDTPPQEELETLDPQAFEETRPNLNPDTTQTLELNESGVSAADNEKTKEPKEPGAGTVVSAGEQTVDFTGQSIDTDSIDIDLDVTDSMVTAQWLDNVAGGESDPEVTIKQKETIALPGSESRSSLVVKSRHFTEPGKEGSSFVSPADAPDYELIEKIGEGGMGVVYTARQSSIARTVAIKMLKGDEEHTLEQREKFISEAVVTGELDHPNIVPIYDLGSNDSGALFYSMKRVRGTPWDDVVKQKSLDENLNILLRVADAIAFAHANGVLHRDLKPENVMLGDFGEVLVMDWGLARISADFPSADAVSQSDVMGGTPAYMAPEMATGPIEEITTASDIYLLGAILFEILSGRPPHSGRTVMACLFAAAKNKFVESSDSENQFSGELFDIAMRAMATKPDERYGTVQDFQAAVRLYQSHSESVLLTESASKNLEAAINTDDYDLYSRSVYGFEEALSLWSGNQSAQELLSASRGAYAQSALERTDFELGISLLDAEAPEHADLLAQLIAGRDESESRQRRLTWMKRAVAALLLAVAGIVSVSYFAVRTERNKAIVERDRADENFREAEAARKVADEQRAIALTQKERAESEKERAETEKERAETEQARAEREEAKAKEQEQLAIRAKQAEAYEAYVARIGLANAKIEENAFDRALELLKQCDPELRHWEWGRLSYLCQLSRQTWRVDAPVEAVAISPDGRTFASGDWDGKAQLWDLQTGAVLHSMTHGQYVHAVAFDASGHRLATGSSDHTVHIYEVESGELLQTLAGHTDAVVSVRFSADGKRLLTAGFDNTARIWDLGTGELVQTLTGHSWWVWAAEFSPDDSRIVTVSQDGKAIVWQRDEQREESNAYRPLTEFAKHRGPIYAAQFSPDGAAIATAGHDRRVLLWNPDEVQPVDIARRLDRFTDPPAPFRELTQHEGPVRTLAFSPDGSQLVSGGQDNVLRIWDLAANRQRTVLRGHASHVRDCVFSPDGQLLLSAGRDQQIKLWQPSSYAESLVLGADEKTKQADAVLAARFSRDGKFIVTANRDRTATLWDAQTQSPLQRFAEGHEFLASSAVFTADGSRLATGAGDGTARIWDVATGTEILQLEGTGRTASLAVSPDGKWIATGSPGNNAIVWNAQTGEQTAVLTGHEAAVTSLGFSPDGQMLATGDDLGRCRLWDLQTGSDEWIGSHWLRGHSRSITALAFVEQGRRLLTASGDNTCGQWDVASGRELTERVLRHPDWVTDMAVSQDGTRALTSCDDGKLRLWSLAEAQVLREIDATGDVVFTSVDLSPDGSRALAATAANGTVQMWNLETGDEIHSASPTNDEAAWMEFGDRAGILWAAKFAPRGNQVLTIGGNDARLWDVATRESVVRFSPHGAVAAADISPNEKLLVTGSWDRSAKIWDIATGKAVRKLDGLHQGYVNSVEFSPDGQTILTGSDDGTARLWDVATGRPSETIFRGHDSRIRQATFSSDGGQVLTTANDKTARIWDRQTGEPLQTLVGHEWAVLCGEFSRDGRRIITGSEDNTALIWNASTGKPLLKLAGHTDSITSVAFSPDGRRAMTASQDNTAKLWDAETGKEILTLTGHHQELTSVSFSPNGNTVLTSGRDGATILWPAVDWRKSPE
ncbi:MAG: protein kinase [Planctomycetes bacterium]|nr:protein kinase [Planctomycetota bacterium]